MPNAKNLRLFNAAKAMLTNAYAPYSHYAVAACVESASGAIFSACNVENAAYGLTLCAETNAISQMVSSGERLIRSVLVLADNDTMCSPCGACRQRIEEFCDEHTKIHCCNQHQILKTVSMNELLPHAFGPRHFMKTLP